MNSSEHDENDRPSDSAVTTLLRQAFDEEPPKRSLLPGIQERIRIHTRGRYFRKKSNPLRSPVLVLLGTACFLLILGAVLYATLAPMLMQSR